MFKNPAFTLFPTLQAENGVQIQNIYDEGTILHRYNMTISITVTSTISITIATIIMVTSSLTRKHTTGVLLRTRPPSPAPTQPATLSLSWGLGLAATER